MDYNKSNNKKSIIINIKINIKLIIINIKSIISYKSIIKKVP